MARRVHHLIFGFLLAPLAVCIPLLLFALAEPVVFPNLNYGVQVWLLVAELAVPIAYISLFAVGFPTYLVLKRLNRISTLHFVLVGLAVGLVPGVVIWVSGPSGDDRVYPALFICCAAAVSLTFGLIVQGTQSDGDRRERIAA